MTTRRIGIIGYEGVNALDFTGPSEVFADASVARKPAAYEVLYLSAGGAPFRSWSGIRFAPDMALEVAPPLDTIIVPGGTGIRAPEVLDPLAAWLRLRAPQTRRLVSVCTGVIALAAAGLIDGRRATTHWRYAAEVAKRFPKVRLEPDAIFIREGQISTSAGITAGIDLALALVEEDLGPSVSLAVARELVVYLKRSGGQQQYSEPLRFQARAAGRFADLAAWIPANLTADLSVEALAARVNVGPRHFARRFKAAFEVSPGGLCGERSAGRGGRTLAGAGRAHHRRDRRLGGLRQRRGVPPRLRTAVRRAAQRLPGPLFPPGGRGLSPDSSAGGPCGDPPTARHRTH